MTRWLWALAYCITAATAAWGLPLERLKLPDGFQISIFSADVSGARSLARGALGTIFVGTRTDGVVYALRDTNADGKADSSYRIAKGLNEPNGVAVHGADLYVAEVNRVIVFRNIELRLATPPRPELISDRLPDDQHHGWKFIGIGPDDKLYVPVGAPCNVCEEDDERYASILRMDLDGNHQESFARGVRNTVGFDWNPRNGELWFSDNGRDMMGDDLPPDELNRAPRPGLHFGFPYCHGKQISDPDYGSGRNCSTFEPPALELGAHVAALGLRFYRGSLFPAAYRGGIFMAEHGSWNRTKPVGYRVVYVVLDGDHAVREEPFVEGWLTPSGVWGRPVDVLEQPDGSLLISDDYAGAVYRVTYSARKN